MKTLKLKKMKTLKYIYILPLLTLFFVACSNDDDAPEPINEEEVITTLIATLVPVSGPTLTLTTRDLDGDGPNEPNITVSGNFAANTTYNGSLNLLNETVSPPESITNEIEEEGDEHQFFFQATNNIATFTYTDSDANDKPIGLNFRLTTGNAGTGEITIILRHEPNKSASGVEEGNIANAGGETDISVTFNVTVQ